MLTVTVWLSSVGVGLLALPPAVLSALKPAPLPVQVGSLLQAVDAGQQSQGYYVVARLSAPMVVNLGGLNVSWLKNSVVSAVETEKSLTYQHYVGVRLGTLNTTVPINCPGSGTVLQVDALVGDYALKLSKIGGTSDALATRIDYDCDTAQ